MPILLEEDLDRRATHQRLPNVTAVTPHGNQADPYGDLQQDVPIRIEQPERGAAERGPSDVVAWTAWVLSTITNAPQAKDRFVLPDRTLRVAKVEDLTDLDGTLDHYQLDCEEVWVG